MAGTTSYEYYGSGEGRLKKITQPDGRHVTYEYNAMGLTSKVIPSAGPTVEYTYTKDRVTQVKVGNDTTSYAYDELGRRTSVTDPMNKTTEYAYDGLGRLIGITAHDDSYTSFSYDVEGHLTAFRDGQGNRTEYLYDVGGRLAATYQYDDTNALWEIDAIVYADSGSCAECGGSGEIAKTSHFTSAEQFGTSGTITWKTFEYDSNSRLRYARHYQPLTFNPSNPGNLGTLDRTVEYCYNELLPNSWTVD